MTANIIPFTSPKVPERKCSFCGRAEAQCQKLIESAVFDHCICDVCVAQAVAISAEVDRLHVIDQVASDAPDAKA